MAKVNRQLVLNLANDLMVLQKVVADLARRVGDSSIKPRRPPQCIGIIKPATTTRLLRRPIRKDEHASSSTPDCAQYLLLLELLYDRSQAVTCLFLRWLYQLIASLEGKADLPEPLNSTGLGYLFEQLYSSTQRFGDLIFHASRRCCLHSSKCLIAEENGVEKERCDRGNQASSALQCCESCREMQEVMKGVVKSIRVQLGDCCQTARTRSEVRAELNTLSQLGATHRLVDAINKDICALLDCVAEATVAASTADRRAAREAEVRTGVQLVLQETEKLLQETDKKAVIAQAEVMQWRNKITEMEKTAQIAEERCASKEEQKKQTEKALNAAMLTIQDLGVQLSCQRSQALQKVSEAQSALVRVKSEKTAMNKELKNILHRETSLQAKVDLELCLNETLKEELKKERVKKQEQELYISELEIQVHHLKQVLNETCRNKESLQIRLSESVVAAEALRVRAEEERKMKQTECDDLREKLKAMADHEALLISYPDFHGPLERCEGGDPVIDMESQVRANELRVRLLNEQTARLRVTLEKLRRLTDIPPRKANQLPRPPKTAPAVPWAPRNDSSSEDDDSCKKIYPGKTRFHPHSWSD